MANKRKDSSDDNAQSREATRRIGIETIVDATLSNLITTLEISHEAEPSEAIQAIMAKCGRLAYTIGRSEGIRIGRSAHEGKPVKKAKRTATEKPEKAE